LLQHNPHWKWQLPVGLKDTEPDWFSALPLTQDKGFSVTSEKDVDDTVGAGVLDSAGMMVAHQRLTVNLQ
jgi:hypothetical protein